CLPKIEVKIKVSSVYWNSITHSHDAQDMLPVDVAPGSPDPAGGVYNKAGNNVSNAVYGIFFGLQHPTYDPNTHVWSVSKFGPGSVFGGGVNASMYTDGIHFCYIPTVSAFDYDHGSYFDDIEAQGINTKLGNTPFDVIYGVPSYYTTDRVGLGTNPTIEE